MKRSLSIFSVALAACTTTVPLGPIAPRLVSPLSSATVTSSRPTLRWEPPAGALSARVELCADRACASVLTTIDAPLASAVPSFDLAAGPVFWRVTVDGVASATWELFVRHRSASVSTSWGTTLDVNADGHPDLAVAGGGTVYLYLGSDAAIDATSVIAIAPPTPDPAFGSALASAGDVNGDGFVDLAVGAPGFVYVHLGAADGVDTSPSVVLSGSDGFGASVASIGDTNRDGYADLGVGDARGGVRIFLGSPAGLVTDAPVVLAPPADGTLGVGLSSDTDTNGDGFTDVLVPGTTTANVPCVYLYLGTTSGLEATPIRLDGADDPNSGFGTAISSGADLDGDGYAEVVVGAPFDADAALGRVYVFRGGATGPSMPSTIDDPGTLADGDGGFGATVASAADANGDGFDDLVIGAPTGRMMRGAAYFYFGSATGVASDAGSLFDGVSALSEFGTSVGSAGDVDGDGYTELVVGAPSEGRVFVFTGNRGGPAQPRAATLTNPGEGAFGATLAGHPR